MMMMAMVMVIWWYGGVCQCKQQAFECLCELGGAEASRAQMAAEGTCPLILSLMARYLGNPRLCELAAHISMLLMSSRAEVQEQVAALPYDGGLAVVLHAMRSFSSDGGVQCCGAGALAAATANNSSNATIIVAQGGIALICAAMRSFPFPGDVLLQWHCTEVLRNLVRSAAVAAAAAAAAAAASHHIFWYHIMSLCHHLIMPEFCAPLLNDTARKSYYITYR